ncbi:hemolysins-related protein [Photobacterium iliopiscarium]|nr:hemolysins-related protein [Photobacterium iliopiscarium]
MQLPKLKLPFWMGRGELAKLALVFHSYWQRVKTVLELPLKQLDPMTAPIGIVDLLAWQRDVQRLATEPETIYRIRVAFAYQFASGAGSVAGWHDMFEKLGFAHITLDERLSHVDWDVISLKIRDGDLSSIPGLLDEMCRQYGRTCRRYQYTTYLDMPIMANPNLLDGDQQIAVATTKLEVMVLPSPNTMDMDFECVVATSRA